MQGITLILIWGSLLYSLLYVFPTADYIKDNFLASALSIIDDTFNKQVGVVNIFDDKGNLKNAVFHIGKDLDIYDIKAAPGNSSRIFAGTNHGLFVSRDNGSNWYEFSDAERLITSDAKVYKILFDSKGNGFVSVYQKGKGFVCRSSDNLFSLDKIFEIEDEAVYDFASNKNDLFLGLSDGKLIRYSLKENNSRVLTVFDSPITNLEVENDGSPIFLSLKNGGFWISENGGQNFSRQKYLADYKGAEKIQDFKVDARHGNTIYAATDYGLIKSSDLGGAWQIFRSLPSEKSEMKALALIPNPGEIYPHTKRELAPLAQDINYSRSGVGIYAATPDKVYKTKDLGSSWEIFEPKIGGREISVLTSFYDKIIVGTRR